MTIHTRTVSVYLVPMEIERPRWKSSLVFPQISFHLVRSRIKISLLLLMHTRIASRDNLITAKKKKKEKRKKRIYILRCVIITISWNAQSVTMSSSGCVLRQFRGRSHVKAADTITCCVTVNVAKLESLRSSRIASRQKSENLPGYSVKATPWRAVAAVQPTLPPRVPARPEACSSPLHPEDHICSFYQ